MIPVQAVKDIYNKWEYKYVPSKPFPTNIEIIPDRQISQPKELCKYYSLNEHNIRAFSHNYFYGTHPLELNDPFDFNKNMLNINPKFLNFFYNTLFSYLGVLSMTISEVDQLMWSHYTSHRGFVVKYSIDKIPENFKGPFPINYIDEYVPINKKDPFINLLIAFNIKYKKYWESENEWRFLLYSPRQMKLPKFLQDKIPLEHRAKYPRYFKYSKYFSIKEVILGYKLFLNEKVKSRYDQNIGLEITTKDCQIIKFLSLLINDKFKTFIVDLNPLEYSSFVKKEVSVVQIGKNKFELNYIK